MFIVLLWVSISAFAYDFELPAGNGMQKLRYDILSSVDQTVAVVGGTTGIIPCSVTYNNKKYTVTEIGRFAFNDADITDYRLPLSLKVIRENAFGFSKASTIAIPDGVEVIESGAFWHSLVKTIIIGSGVKYIGDGAFKGCSILKTLVFRPQKAPNHESRGYEIGNSKTSVIVPQLSGYEGSEIARVIAGTMIEPIHFKQNKFEYLGVTPTLDYVKKINTASTQRDMNLKNKDVGTYEQTFNIGLSEVIPSYSFSDFDGYPVFPDRGIDVLYEYSITKKPLFVKIINHQRMYGEPNPSSFAYSIDGFVDGEDENQLLSPIKCETTASIQSPVGSYPITCNPSALNYSFEIQPGLLNIQKAPIDIAIQNSSRTYGDENPIYQYNFIGLRCGDTDPEITSALEFTNINKSSDCGEYSISILSGELRNYYINNIQSGTLSIIPAPLLLKVQNAEKIYYEKNPEFKFLLEGLRNNDTHNCISSQPSFTCTASLTSQCGEYEITASNAHAHNYEISYESGILTITQAPLTLVASDIAREYGEVNPVFKYSAIGLKGEDSLEASLESQPRLTTTATKNSSVGEYPIVISEGSAKNYKLAYRAGVLTINKAPLTVVAENVERMYGDFNPAFTCSYLGFKLNDTESTAFSSLPKLGCAATKTSDVGTYPIVATEGFSRNYDIAAYESGTLTVTKAPLVLSVNDKSRLYYEDNPTFDFSLTGLRNNDTHNCISSQPSFTCTASLTSQCGEYEITASNAHAHNYEISYESGILTITQAPLTLVASDIAREYGEVNPVFKYSAIGLKGEDSLEASLESQPRLTTTATKNSSVGEYPIVISEGSAKNYKLAYRAGVLTINKAPLTVVAENIERMYGDSNPAFTRSYLGFKLNDTESSAFSSLPKLSCAATKTSDAGTYPITVTGGTSHNYDIVAYENGTLTVTKAPLVLSVNDKSRLYYEDNPTFDFSLTGLRNGDVLSCLSVIPKYECQANKSSVVGNYTVVPFGAESKNYSIEYRNGTLSILPRQLQASVGNYSKVYGTDNPQFEVVYNGFVNNENKSVLTNQVVANCSAERNSDVGTYPIILTDGAAINYVISKYNNGELSIEKADQALIWKQDLSNIPQYSQIALEATSSAGLPITYEMSPNNVATLYDNGGTWYLDCYGSGAVYIRALQNGDKNYNAAAMLSKTLVVFGSGGNPSNPQIYLNIETAGTLPTLIAENKKYQIKNLHLSGYLNGTDINFLREMAGCDSYGKATPGVLEILDISKCTIVSGGRSYYKSYRTFDNKVSDYMFYKCKVLTNLILPDNLTTIDECAFADCERLSVIAIPNDVVSFGQQAFLNCISLLRIPMPNRLTSIGNMAFSGCNSITEISIPASVSYLGDGIVKNCQNIERINVEPKNTNFASKDGVLYTSTLDELLIYPVAHDDETYQVLESASKIAPFAFVNAKKLKHLTLPEVMASIGEDAFIGCVNLSTLQVRAITPPICDNDCFESVSKTRCELQVPQGCYSYYWVAPVWSDFNKIVETPITGMTELESEQARLRVDGSTIIINGVNRGHYIRIFQTDGTLLYQYISDGNDVRYRASSNGVYIVVLDNQSHKIAIK